MFAKVALEVLDFSILMFVYKNPTTTIAYKYYSSLMYSLMLHSQLAYSHKHLFDQVICHLTLSVLYYTQARICGARFVVWLRTKDNVKQESSCESFSSFKAASRPEYTKPNVTPQSARHKIWQILYQVLKPRDKREFKA
jgi:hypothetical protein